MTSSSLDDIITDDIINDIIADDIIIIPFSTHA